ncbi:hypothetical protein ABZ345_27030 [Lentzea sp. NPDC005914]|uniref:hypothetical protein n=1 Tax=Lentzea sp. NPDC005914 TaxID=3154572 RepID=UPI0033FE89DB
MSVNASSTPAPSTASATAIAPCLSEKPTIVGPPALTSSAIARARPSSRAAGPITTIMSMPVVTA